MPPGTLATAEQRAVALGIGADQVLISAGIVSEDDYVRALAGWLHVPFEPLNLPRDACPLTDGQFIDAAKCGLLPRYIGGALIYVVAPRDADRAPPRDRRASDPGAALPADHGPALAPLHRWPWRAGARRARRGRAAYRTARAFGRAASVAARRRMACGRGGLRERRDRVSASASVIDQRALALTFLAWTALRLIGAATAWSDWRTLRIPPGDLPVYTIIVALYDEAGAAQDLIAALRGLDYPPEKLQILLALEPDDVATRDALLRLDLGPPFEIVIAPEVGPRTKPKALNAALAFARGTFTAVFDAEDRPAPDQLHRALDVFLVEGAAIACVQARLTIDNTADSWLARLFTAEYAGLFDVLLPGLAQRRLPLPLGGSSNHFRTAALREVGGWDPYNVTEDADLGMRLARFGYRAAVIDSTTYEEAPARFGPWLRQRTALVQGLDADLGRSMRHPVRLARELGLSGFPDVPARGRRQCAGGAGASDLYRPARPLRWARRPFSRPRCRPRIMPLAALSGGALVAGYLTSAALGLIGLKRRGLARQGWVLLLMPLHWLLLSLAAWRALYQLLRDPYRWEKTAHGLARTSRLAAEAGTARTTIVRNSAADRPPRPRAAA